MAVSALLLVGSAASLIGLAIKHKQPNQEQSLNANGSNCDRAIPWPAIGDACNKRIAGGISISEDVRGKVYIKPDQWEMNGQRYDVQVILGESEQGEISLITIAFPYQQGISEVEAKTLDQAIRQYFYSTFDRSIIEESTAQVTGLACSQLMAEQHHPDARIHH